MRTVDAHVHAWRYHPARHHWIDPGSILARDYMPSTAWPAMDAAGIAQMILVQAESSANETAWLLDLARADDRIGGVVGWRDLMAPDVASTIADLAVDTLLVGLRHQVQDEPDDFLERAAFASGVRACLAAGLSYDLLVFARQLRAVPAFLDRIGDGRLILDHGGKPEIATGGWQPWADAIRTIAARPNTWCKLSGFVTEAGHAGWTVEQIQPYMDFLLERFGPERLIFGSDWPVCCLAGSYADVFTLASDFVRDSAPASAELIFGGNARQAYTIADQDA